MNFRRLFLFCFIVLAFVVAGCGGQTATGDDTTAVSTNEPIEEPVKEPTNEPIEEPTSAPSEEPTSLPEEEGETLELDIKGFLFRPEVVTIALGTAVQWTNLDDIQHTVTSGVPDNPTDAFDSDFFFQNELFTHTFEAPGEYPFFCQRHPHMQATIIVEE